MSIVVSRGEDWDSSSSGSGSSSSTGAAPDVDAQEAFIAASTCTASIYLLICTTVAYYVKKRKLYWIPESVTSMALGIAGGAFILLVKRDYSKELIFDPRIFFFVLLPPIIFSAGYNLKRKNFFKYFSAIMLFAVPGTIIAIAVVGFGLYYIGIWGMFDIIDMSLLDCFIFASVIANVDPVATISIFNAINVNKMLHSIVFGESMLNDAVSVVLFHTLTNLGNTDLQLNSKSFFTMMGLFVGESLGTIALGISVGLIACFFFKHTAVYLYPPIETILLILFSYISFVLPEILDLSGIMSLFFCGIVLAHYNWYNLSEESRATTRHGVEAASFFAETAVYVYIGVNFAFSFANVTKSLDWHWRFLLVTLLLCLISRALGIFCLSFLYNRVVKSDKKIPFKVQFVLFFGGLRGSAAFALALNVPGPNTPIIVTTVLAVVLITTVFCGGLTEKVVSVLHLRESRQEDLETIMGGHLTALLAGDMSPGWQDRSTGCMSRWKSFEFDYMKRWFGGKHLDRLYRGTREELEEEEQAKEQEVLAHSNDLDIDGLPYTAMPHIAKSPIDDVAQPPGSRGSSSGMPSSSPMSGRSFTGSPKSSPSVRDSLASPSGSGTKYTYMATDRSDSSF